LLSFLEATGPKTTVQVAQQESIAVGLVAEMIGSAERDGKVVRDEEAEGKELRWWPNYFEGYVWDGD
jgi:ESCRT-II complex subunit VPS36